MLRMLPTKQPFIFCQGSLLIRCNTSCTLRDSKSQYSSFPSLSMISGAIYLVSRLSSTFSSYPWSRSKTNQKKSITTSTVPVTAISSAKCFPSAENIPSIP